MKKRLLAFLMILVLLLSSCSSPAPKENDESSSQATENQVQNSETTDTAYDDETPSSETVEEHDVFEGLESADYDGHAFTMMIRPLDLWIDDVYSEELTGEALNDAVYTRNNLICERYNITMGYVESGDTNYDTSALSTILAGEDAYDIIIPHGRASFEYANKNACIDWISSMPNTRLDEKWWSSDAKKNLSINGRVYTMIGDFGYSMLGDADVMVFNKDLYKNLGIDLDIYQTVLDGKWTFEKFASLINENYADLDGDGVMTTDKDRFGYITQKWVGPVEAFATSGLRVISKDENDLPYISFYSEKTVDVFNRYFELIDSDSCFVDTSDISNSPLFTNIFIEGRSLFSDMNMFNLITLRNMETDFGVIPWPKYDESSAYCTNVDAGTNMFIVPITASDTSRTSMIVEAMACAGSNIIIPAFYDVTLQGKTSRDTESAAMLDIIKSSVIFDLGYYNQQMGSTFSNEFVDFVTNNSRDIASWYNKNLKLVSKQMEKVLDAYTK